MRIETRQFDKMDAHITDRSGLMEFPHHTDAEAWVCAHAQGDVCVIDSWTYGKMEFEINRPGRWDGWKTVN